MDVDTPKKLVHSHNVCYLCSCTPPVKERVRIFGKSTHDLPKLINSALCVDLEAFAESDLIVCTNPCYKKLLKLENLEKNIAALKEELGKRFAAKREQARVKRLRKDSDSDSSTITTNRAGALRSLNFDSPGPTTCTSYSYDANATFQKPCKLLHRAFGHFQAPEPRADQLSPFVPFALTLTPIPLSKPVQIQGHKETNVRITVAYPSKTVNKILEPPYEAIGKALVHGPPERIANAVVKCEPVINVIVKQVMHKVQREVNGLCSRKNPSILRRTAKDDLQKFSMKAMCHEWKEMAPTFYAFLMTVALSNGTQDSTWLPSVAVAGSILLKQRSRYMNATAVFLAILLKTASTEVSYFE